MSVIRLSLAAVTLAFLAACVTINIYFPAAAAEQAAEEIVEDILGSGQAPAAPAREKGAALERPAALLVARAVLDFLVPAAHAAQPDFNVNTPGIRKLQAQMKQRHASLSPYYDSGAVGFTRDALVGAHDSGAIGLKDRNRVNKLVADENRDRNGLYRAIAEANGHPEWEPDVRAVFVTTWIDKARRGWWYQNSKGRWQQK
ncbi:MAG: YdbL family protein [Candidatus Sedimenticola endophacoides]